jgi:hypothetical protein
MVHHKKRFTQAARKAVYYSLRSKPEKEANLPHMKEHPTSSQLGGFREIAAFIRYEKQKDLKLLIDWLQKKRKQDKWDKDWLNWVESWVTQRKDLWGDILEIQFPSDAGLDLEYLKIFGVCTFIEILCEGIFDKEENTKQEGMA